MFRIDKSVRKIEVPLAKKANSTVAHYAIVRNANSEK